VFQIQQTDVFSAWLSGLRDPKSKARIVARIESARLGNLGDVKSLGGGLSEMRVHFGTGYRLYFVRTGKIVLLLLSGGDKSTQKRDIERARRMRKELIQE